MHGKYRCYDILSQANYNLVRFFGFCSMLKTLFERIIEKMILDFVLPDRLPTGVFCKNDIYLL